MKRRDHRLLVATASMVTAGVLAFALPATAVGPAPTSAAAAVPVLAWQPCADPSQNGFDCATAEVPLNYQDPEDSTIELALVRHSAADPARRIGSLFFNPGGPGGSGTESLPAWLELFPATLRARFDLISWDPRGIGESASVQCFATPDDGLNFFTDQTYEFPEQQYAVQCAESPNPRRPTVFRALAAFSFGRAGDVGPDWSWGDE